MKRDLNSTRNIKVFTDLNLSLVSFKLLRLLKRHRSHDNVNMADRIHFFYYYFINAKVPKIKVKKITLCTNR